MWQQIHDTIKSNIDRISEASAASPHGPSSSHAKLLDPRLESIDSVSLLKSTAKVSYMAAEVLGPVREGSSSGGADILVLARQPYRDQPLGPSLSASPKSAPQAKSLTILLAIHSEVLLMCPAAASKGTCLLLQDMTVLGPTSQTHGLVCGVVCSRNLLGLYEGEGKAEVKDAMSGPLHQAPGADDPEDLFSEFGMDAISRQQTMRLPLSDSILTRQAPPPPPLLGNTFLPSIAERSAQPQSLSSMLQKLTGMVKGAGQAPVASSAATFSGSQSIELFPAPAPMFPTTAMLATPLMSQVGASVPSIPKGGATRQQATLMGLFAKKKAEALAASVSRCASEVPHANVSPPVPASIVDLDANAKGASRGEALAVEDDEVNLFPSGSPVVEAIDGQPPAKLARTETLPPPPPPKPQPPIAPSLEDLARLLPKATVSPPPPPSFHSAPLTSAHPRSFASSPTFTTFSSSPSEANTVLEAPKDAIPTGPTISSVRPVAPPRPVEPSPSLATEITKAPTMRKFKPPGQKAVPPPVASEPDTTFHNVPPQPPLLPPPSAYGSSFLLGRGVPTPSPATRAPNPPIVHAPQTGQAFGASFGSPLHPGAVPMPAINQQSLHALFSAPANPPSASATPNFVSGVSGPQATGFSGLPVDEDDLDW